MLETCLCWPLIISNVDWHQSAIKGQLYPICDGLSPFINQLVVYSNSNRALQLLVSSKLIIASTLLHT